MKVNELSGARLDYWVARAEWGDNPLVSSFDEFKSTKWVGGKYEPSSNWEQAGPIIDRLYIMVCHTEGHLPLAIMSPVSACGETKLEAAMRCYVMSKFGPEVTDES